MKKVVTLLMVLLLVVAMATGCSAPAAEQSAAPAPASEAAPAPEAPADEVPEAAKTNEEVDLTAKRVVFLVKQMSNDFWVELVDAAKAQAESYGVALEVLCPLTADSNEEQIALLEQSLLDPPDFYIIAASDSQGIVPAIEKINDAGIPIVTIDTQITDENVDVMAFVGSNNYSLGYDLAMAAIAKTGIEAGRVVIIEGKTGAASSIDRTAGAEAAYVEKGWTVVDKQPGNWSRDESYNTVQNLLQKYNDIDVIQFNSVSMALGAYDAVVKSGQDVKCVAVDKSAESLQLMVDSGAATLMCLIDNPPDYMGKTGVDIAVSYFKGEQIESSYTASGSIIAPDEACWADFLAKYSIQD